MKHNMEAFDTARKIVSVLREAGHEAFFVGGCVRDRVLGRVPKDYDVATGARPEQVTALLPGAVTVGAKFGVVLWRGTEVATFRSEGAYTDYRRPDVVSFGTMRQDAARRDFTVNAMYELPDPANPHIPGQLFDFYDGTTDACNRVLRAVGNPDDRFREDALRLLRAVRFAAELDFEMEPHTLRAVTECAPLLRHISRERIQAELWQMLGGNAPSKAVRLLAKTGLLDEIFPTGVVPDAESAARCLDELPGNLPPAQAMAALLRDGWPVLSSQIRHALVRLRLSAQDRQTVEALLVGAAQLAAITCEEQIRQAPVRRLTAHDLFDPAARLEAAHARAVGRSDTLIRAVVRERERLLQQNIPLAPEPLVTGKTLRAQFALRPGPAFRRILEEVYDAQLEGRVQTDEEAAAFIHDLIRRDKL